MDKLREEIREALGLKAEHVVINRLTGHIIVKVCFFFCFCEGGKEALILWGINRGGIESI